VIGNSAYPHLPQLPSAATDAVRMTEKLRALRFLVDQVTLTTASRLREQRAQAVRGEGKRRGHCGRLFSPATAFSYGPHNWLAPLDMPVTLADDDLADAAVSRGKTLAGTSLRDRQRSFSCWWNACRRSPIFDSR
jgi:hypothetical protein